MLLGGNAGGDGRVGREGVGVVVVGGGERVGGGLVWLVWVEIGRGRVVGGIDTVGSHVGFSTKNLDRSIQLEFRSTVV